MDLLIDGDDNVDDAHDAFFFAPFLLLSSNSGKVTPLLGACMKGDSQVVSALLEAKANVAQKEVMKSIRFLLFTCSSTKRVCVV